jgi:glycosyltransferase involved in cell wall biosynthesis
MRVIFLTHYFPPEVGAPQVRIEALARGLARRGAVVTVHTCVPHYPDGQIREPYRNRVYQVGHEGSIRVARSIVYPAPNRGFLKRIAGHASSALGAVLTSPLTGRADVVVAESPPLFTGAAAIAYAATKRAALVVNVADRWPASAVELGALRQRRLIDAASWLEQRCYRAAAELVSVSDRMAAELEALDSARGKVRVIGPAVDVEAFRQGPPPAGRPLRLLYAGTVGAAQGLETVVEAARLAGPDAVQLTIAGDGAEAAAIRDSLDRSRVANVRMLGSVPHDQVPGLYADAHAAVVALRALPIFDEAIPTKLLEAMAAGRAVLLSGRGEAARLVSRHEAGIVVAPESPAALAAGLRQLAHDPDRLQALGAAGRRAAAEKFSRERFIDRWWDLLQAVTGPRPPASATRRRAG